MHEAQRGEGKDGHKDCQTEKLGGIVGEGNVDQKQTCAMTV